MSTSQTGQFLVFAKPRSTLAERSLSTGAQDDKTLSHFVGFGKNSAPSDSVGRGTYFFNLSMSDSDQMGMFNSVAFCNLLPASAPAKTMSVFGDTDD